MSKDLYESYNKASENIFTPKEIELLKNAKYHCHEFLYDIFNNYDNALISVDEAVEAIAKMMFFYARKPYIK